MVEEQHQYFQFSARSFYTYYLNHVQSGSGRRKTDNTYNTCNGNAKDPSSGKTVVHFSQ